MSTSTVNNKNAKQIRARLLQWYRIHRRPLPWRDTGDPYRIWVSEVMLQQTQVKTVVPYYTAFLERFPNVRTLAAADLQDVLKAWEGLGYYARARNLHRAAGLVCRLYGGNMPDRWEDLRALPGVGDYIAAAVLSIAFQRPFPVVDGNVKRLISRLFLVDQPVNSGSAYGVFKELSAQLLDAKAPGEFNQAMMELGALICAPRRPGCTSCPLNALCGAHGLNRTDEFPKREPRKPVPEYDIAVVVITKGNRVLITRRKPEGLLGGLWEFPGGKVRENETPEQACVREIREEVNLRIEIASSLTTVRHAYTHFKIRMHVFCCRFQDGRVRLNGPVDHRWVRLSELSDYPFPKANHKFMDRLAACMEGRR
ncbi:MAG: A/G-specific adenine glycosylase [Deltaproteobacteria bacterium]|nr:A/G-specific adenine glycosylase [Deltaproteobacteria bacterium]